MMDLINRFLSRTASEPRGAAYAVAMSESGDLLKRMDEESRSSDAVRAVMASIWRQRNNVPLVTTVYEAVAEMQSPMYGTEGRAPPEPNT